MQTQVYNTPKPNKFIKRLITIVIVCGVIVILVNQVIKSGISKKLPEPITVTKQSSSIDINKTLPSTSYFLTRQRTVTGILDYTWSNNELVVATKDGISDAVPNNINYWKGALNYANFNSNGQGIFYGNGAWHIINVEKNDIYSIDFDGKLPKINKNGDKLISFNNSELILTDISSSKTSNESIDTKSEIKSTNWAYNTDNIAITRIKDDILYFDLYDQNLKRKLFFEIPKEDTFVDINPTATYVIMKATDTLILRNLETNREININLNEGTSISGNWITNDSFILIGSQIDKLERPIDVISKVNIQGSMSYLVTTVGLPNKADTSIYLKVNQGLNVLPIVEKESVIWLLGLNPFVKPEFIGPSLNFIPVEKKSSNNKGF